LTAYLLHGVLNSSTKELLDPMESRVLTQTMSPFEMRNPLVHRVTEAYDAAP
jgi:hypothetical protein